MKAIKSTLLIISMALAASSCTRAAPTVLPPEEAMTQAGIAPPPTAILLLPTNTAEQEATPSEAPAKPTSDEATKAATQAESSATALEETATAANTATPAETATPADTATPVNTPTPTVSPTTPFTPTATPIPFDPYGRFGIAQLIFPGDGSWLNFIGTPPNTENIRIQVSKNQLEVTSKLDPANDLFTWWFSWPKVKSFYLEMSVENGECQGKDAYGLIFYGPPTGEVSHGYIASFSCDGFFSLYRIDTPYPNYSGQELIGWTRSPFIETGPEKVNKLGLWVENGEIELYANGQYLGYYMDSLYTTGRFGVAINAGETQNYTYWVNQIIYWNLD